MACPAVPFRDVTRPWRSQEADGRDEGGRPGHRRHHRAEAAERGARSRASPGRSGAPTSASGSGARSARTTATDGNAWDYFTHDQSRSRAYRWGEDGLGGISDDKQRLCFALALWNERDPILKERAFGLTNGEGNHGEDVKEYYFYLDSTPTHSYMKYLYKYPQREFPYRDLIETNRRRTREELEYELLDTGIFDDDRYFDVFVEYAKAAPEEILIRVSGAQPWPRDGPAPRCSRRCGSGTPGRGETRPGSRSLREKGGSIAASHPELGDYTLSCDGAPELLFTENETNAQKLWGQPNPTPYVKDAFHRYVISGERDAVNPSKTGTKAAARYVLDVPGGRLPGRPAPAGQGRVGRRVRSGVRGGVPAARPTTPTSSTSGSRRTRSARTSGGCTARPWPGCSGRSSSTTSTWTAG